MGAASLGGAHQALMAGLQCLVAESQALVKDLPELLEVAAGGKGYIHQIDGDNTLIEAAVVFGLAGLGVHIGSQEAAAAHAGEQWPSPFLSTLYSSIFFSLM